MFIRRELAEERYRMFISVYILTTDGRTHTAIIENTCGSCNTVLTLNTCYAGTVERFGEYTVEQSVLVRAVPKLSVGEAGAHKCTCFSAFHCYNKR